MNDNGPATLNRKITAARLGILAERLWALALWPSVAACLILALLFSGVLVRLPAPLPLIVMALAAIGAAASLWPLRRLRWPTRIEATRRIELASSLDHRPASSIDDELAEAGSGPAQQAIWQAHKERALARLANARVGRLRSAWPALDGHVFRLPAGLVLVASLLLGPGTTGQSLVASLRVLPAPAAATLSLDAWVKPPTYTGKPPVMLTSPAMVEKLKHDADILVPENAVLTLRLSGVDGGKLTFHDLASSPGDPAELPGIAARTSITGGVFQAEANLTRPVLARLSDGAGRELASWRLLLVPDAAPTIAITDVPPGDVFGTLTVKWKATDDYGVAAITAELVLADEQEDGTGIDGNGIFLYDAPKFPVTLRHAASRDELGTTTAYLAEHPWAGFMVDLTLIARDAAGHETRSAIRHFKLPEKLFVKPLARALIEQRRHLILLPEEQGQVEQMLQALSLYPDGLIDSSGPYLAISTIASRLRATETQDDVDEAVNMLWQTALAIEDGALANARAELDALRRELEKALAEGAPPERIQELMDKMRQAMDHYMQSMAEESRKRLQNGDQAQQNMQQGKQISPQDLRDMLDTIQKLSESGANDAARQMLSELDNILRNLQPGQPQQGAGQPNGNSELGKMLDQLSDILRQQQKLMDDTQRMQPGDGQPNDSGQQGQNGEGSSPDGLAARQGDVGTLLQELMRGLGRQGLEVPKAFGDAGSNMQQSEGALRREDQEEALGRQGDAISKLREGAQGMAEQMMQRGQGQQGADGQHGQARGDSRDPLGRPTSSHAEDQGPDRNIIPGETALRKAREILDMLRERAGEANRPRIERDYIERLLRGLY